MSRRNTLLQAIAVLVEEIAAEPLEAIAGHLESGSAADALALVRAPSTRDRLRVLLREAEGALSHAELALALRASAMTATRLRDRPQVELVWSGPVARGHSPRTTEQALVEVIERARVRLFLVAFAAYKVPVVRVALEAAVARGVSISLLAEWRSPEKRRGAGDILRALGGELAGALRLVEWPAAQRPRSNDGDPAALHAKAAMADDHTLLVTSANLTGDALTINMELGVLVRGGSIPQTASALFAALEQEGTLRPASL